MSPKNQDGENWGKYEKLVMSKLENHDKLLSDVLKQFQTHSEHLADLKVFVLQALEAHKSSCEVNKDFSKLARDIEGIKASLANIRHSEEEIATHTTQIGDIKIEVAKLQVKSGLWGALGGIVSLALLVIATWFKTDFSTAIASLFSGH